MKKKLYAVLLTLALAVSLTGAAPGSAPVRAKTTESQADLAWIRSNLVVMGIVDGTLSEADYDSYIKREEFTKLLVNASVYQGKAERKVTSSLYSDVKSGNAYAGYIKLAVNQGWMGGFVDGTFRPNGGVQMKVAAKAVLGLLGFTSADFTGNKVSAQMSKFNSLGLNAKINKTRNRYLTWEDCMRLFYNLMSAETKDGKIYGETLGYPVDSNGDINYLTVLKSNLSGPVLAEGSWQDTLPVDPDTALIYRNETVSSKGALQDYDVLYYSEKAGVIWAYDNKVTGAITAVSPDRVSPESVTVAGASFKLGTQKLVYDFSALGNYRLKQTVTLFLGMNDEVAAVRTTEEYSTDVYGAVLRTGTEVSTDMSEPNIVNDYMVVVDVNGNEHTYYYDSGELTITANSAVHVTYEDGAEIITKLSLDKSELSNATVNETATKIGSRTLANDVKILDVCNSSYLKLYPEDLAGVKLYASNLLYFEFNKAGEITTLILNNVSGGSYSYGVVTSANPNKYNPTSYTYMVDGKEKTVNVDKMYGSGVEGAACAITTYDDGSIYMAPLTTGKTVTSLTTTTVKTSSWTKSLSDQVQVYYMDKNGSYYRTTLAKIKNLSLYTVTAYYDSSLAVTNEVKVLIAKDK